MQMNLDPIGVLAPVIMALLLFAIMSPVGAAADAQALAGRWTAVEAERDGAPAPELVGHEIDFAGDRFTIALQNRLIYGGTYSIDSSAEPARIDFSHDEGEAAGTTWQGIYRVDGDRLTICDDAFDSAKERPTAFATAPGSGHVLITFER